MLDRYISTDQMTLCFDPSAQLQHQARPLSADKFLGLGEPRFFPYFIRVYCVRKRALLLDTMAEDDYELVSDLRPWVPP
jgi:hypothetical protein